jgi:hypothetical protein
MEIILNGTTYYAPAPKSRAVRKAMELTKNVNLSDITPEDFDGLIDYLVEIYGRQFTINDVYDNLDADKLIPALMECISSVIGQMGATLERFPKNAQAGVEAKI